MIDDDDGVAATDDDNVDDDGALVSLCCVHVTSHAVRVACALCGRAYMYICVCVCVCVCGTRTAPTFWFVVAVAAGAREQPNLNDGNMETALRIAARTINPPSHT